MKIEIIGNYPVTLIIIVISLLYFLRQLITTTIMMKIFQCTPNRYLILFLPINQTKQEVCCLMTMLGTGPIFPLLFPANHVLSYISNPWFTYVVSWFTLQWVITARTIIMRTYSFQLGLIAIILNTSIIQYLQLYRIIDIWRLGAAHSVSSASITHQASVMRVVSSTLASTLGSVRFHRIPSGRNSRYIKKIMIEAHIYSGSRNNLLFMISRTKTEESD